MSPGAASAKAGSWAAALLACASGVLIFLAFPGWNLHLLAWIGFVPLLLATQGATTRRGFWLGLLAGTVTNAGGFHWMTVMLQEFGHLPAPVTWAILLLQAVTQGLAIAIGVGLWRWLVARGAPSAPSAFLALWAGEVAVPMIFPWFLGNAISPELPMIQIAELGGVPLVSALIYAANVALAEVAYAIWKRRQPPWRFVLATATAVLATLVYGLVRIPQVDAQQAAAPKVKIGMVEGNVGIWEKEARHLDGPARARTLRHNLLKHQQMSVELEQKGAELILWPESAFQPYGALPVLHSDDRFLLVGDAGTVLRHRTAAAGMPGVVRAEPIDRIGLPRDTGLLTGLSSPRGDVWRAIDAGRRVVTVTARGVHTADLPPGETAVSTVTPPVDLFGRMQPGLIVARSGRVWRLAIPGHAASTPGTRPPGRAPASLAGDPSPTLLELPSTAPAQVDLTAAAQNGAGATVLVGRGGVLRNVTRSGVEAVVSPTTEDLWTVAGDPNGALLVAAGARGAVLLGDGGGWVAAALGEGAHYAAWFGPDGTAWLGGERGSLYERPPAGRWTRVNAFTDGDILAGAVDAEGACLVVARGGRLFLRPSRAAANGANRSAFQPMASGSRGELTAVWGFQAQASFLIPRSTRRILPATADLPGRGLIFPENVAADEGVPELERSTPRRGFKTPLLFGALTHGGPLPLQHAGCTDCYNSALLLDPAGNVEAIHDKAFLLMFGEYLPFGEHFPWLYDLSPETSRFQPGTRTAPIDLTVRPGVTARMGILICYEDLVPRYARRVAAHDPNVFVNLTNDAWFGKTAEPEHHLNLALIRTVEYRRWLLRSTNTGISVFIDAVGRRVAETSLDGEEMLLRDVPLLEGQTLYARLGDWPLLLLAAGLLLVTARGLRGSGKGKGRGKAPGSGKPAPRKAKPA